MPETPAYRARIYAPRSVDPNEQTVLTPAAGAPHSDPCQLATITGLSGYQPYLGIPDGRRSRFDPLTRKIEKGTLTVPIEDYRITPGSGNLATTWFTAFVGDASGRPIPRGCKMVIERRLTSTGTWDPYWTGRIQDIVRRGMIVVALIVGDVFDELDYTIGVTRPHPSATGVVTPLLLPHAVSAAYGTISAYNGKGALTGTWKTTGVHRYVELSAASRGRADNILSKRLLARVWRTQYLLGITAGAAAVPAGVRLRFTSSGVGVTDKEAAVTRLDWVAASGQPARIRAIQVVELPSTDPYYTSLTTAAIPDGTAVTCDLRADLGTDTLIQAHYVRVLADLADGYYGPLDASGNPTRQVPRASSFTTLLADQTIPVGRFELAEPVNALEWIERQILAPGRLGLRATAAGELDVFLTAFPTSLAGLPTITDQELAAPLVEWEVRAGEAITEFSVEAWLEAPVSYDQLTQLDTRFPDLPAGPLERVAWVVTDPRWGSVDLRPRRHVVRAGGLRAMDGETRDGASAEQWLAGQAAEISEYYRPLYSQAPITYRFRLRDVAATAGVLPGAWVLLNLSGTLGPPHPGTHQRGGARLLLITSRSEEGLDLVIEALDAGSGSLATAPTLGTAAQEAGNTRHGITLPITLNAQGDPVIVMALDTATSVTQRPADTAAGWRVLYPVAQAARWDARVTTSATHTFRGVPAGRRIWLRARSEGSSGGGSSRLPSAWVAAGGTGYVDTAPIPAPTGVTVSGISATQATVTWTVGDSTLPLIVSRGEGANQAQANASTPSPIATLAAGATRLVMTDLTSGRWYKVTVAHADLWGLAGPAAGTSPTSFQATGTPPTAPTPASLTLLYDGSGAGKQGSAPDYGVILRLDAGTTGYDANCYENGILVETIPASAFSGTLYDWTRGGLPNDNTSRAYTFKLTGAGASEGAASNTVNAVPGALLA